MIKKYIYNILSILIFSFLLTACDVIFPESIFSFFYTFNSKAEVDEPIKFENRSTGAKTYLWDFGDGTTSTLENPTHSYKEKGQYTVALISINNRRKEPYTAKVEIYSKIPKSKIEIGSFDFHINSSLKLKAINEQNDKFKWEVKSEKENLSSNLKEFQINLTQPGRYFISLETSNERGTNLVKDTLIIFSTNIKPGFSYYEENGLKIIAKTGFAKEIKYQEL